MLTRLSAPPAPAWRTVALIAVAVVLIHGLALQHLRIARTSPSPESASAWRFITRTITPSPPSPPAEQSQAPQPARAVKAPEADPAPAPAPAKIAQKPPLAPVDSAQVAAVLIAPKETIPPSPIPAKAEFSVSQAVAAPPPAGKPTTPLMAASSATPAPAVRLKYDVAAVAKGFPVSIKGELLWQPEGNGYNARMEVSHFLLGTRVQTSKGRLTPAGLEPTRFGDKVRSEVAAHFQRDKGIVSFSANTPDVPLEPGAQDQLSLLIQLGAMVAAGPQRFPPGTRVPFQAIGPRSAESWVFTVGESEKLTLPGGELMALKLSREPAVEFGSRAEVWLAPDLGYLPARIRVTEHNGDTVDQQWRATEKP